MSSLRVFFIPFILVLLMTTLNAQVGVGQWRDHLPYSKTSCVAASDEKIYVATDQALFTYEKATGEVSKLNSINGLSDVGVSHIRFARDYDKLIVGYDNGNIDVVEGQSIYNVSDIKRKTIAADKSIRHISFIDQYAILSTGFGIVVFDMERREIKSTYLIGDNGAYMQINETVYDGQYLYAATELGVYKGDFYNDNLADFHEWDIITDIPEGNPFEWLKDAHYNTLVYFNDLLIVNMHDSQKAEQGTLYVYQNEQWEYYSDTTLHDLENLYENGEFLLANQRYYLRKYDTDTSLQHHIWIYSLPGANKSPVAGFAILDTDNKVLIADQKNGLIQIHSEWTHEQVVLNGPASAEVFDIASAGNRVYSVAGGYNTATTPVYNDAEISAFTSETWQSFTSDTDSLLSDVKDLSTVVVNPQNPSQVFAGSWGSGLVEFQNQTVVEHYDATNSSLQPIENFECIRVGGLAFDSEQNLWVVNSGAPVPIHMRSPDGNWTELDYSNQIAEVNIGEMIITETGQKWIILLKGKGLFVFDDNGTPDDMGDDSYHKFSVRDEYGEIISNEVYAIAEDHDGTIWLGTNEGVVVYYNPEDVFDSDFYAQQILIPRNDGTDNADILLGTETVTAIAVDGGDKKWFGTQNGGVFKTSEDGIEQIHHFNTDNSPIFSNTILDIEINGETGEVFMGTDKGIISYRGEATEGEEDFEKVYAFPNPVEPDYSGPITIHGLVAGSYVKITDISGNLVYETRSEGGQAIWYGKDMHGNKVHTGVYLVFSMNEDGSKTNVTKILFVN